MLPNSSLPTISSHFFLTNTKDVRGSVGTVLFWIFVLFLVGRRFSYLANNFRVTAGAVGLSFSCGSQEVCGKLNFPNVFADTMFASVYTQLKTWFRQSTLRNEDMQSTVVTFFKFFAKQDAEWCSSGIHKLISQYINCLDEHTVGRNPFLDGHNYYAASYITKCMNSGVFFHEDFNGANRFLCFCSSVSLKLGWWSWAKGDPILLSFEKNSLTIIWKYCKF